MKIAVTLIREEGGEFDITVTCDGAQTVGAVARALVRTGVIADSQLEKLAFTRSAPITLLARSVDMPALIMLDPEAPFALSGVRDGWFIRPVAEFGRHDSARRIMPLVGYVEVLNGAQQGSRYSLVAGPNTVGRDPTARIYLHDRSVSRRHATIKVTLEDTRVLNVQISDLGSANGIRVAGELVNQHTFVEACDVTLGDTALRVTAVAIVNPPVHLSASSHHISAPRIEPRFEATSRELPIPPSPPTPARLPTVALIAPVMLGGIMFLITHSVMSLVMMAMSPLMMLGSWFDGTFGQRRKHHRLLIEFQQQLRAEGERLARRHRCEIGSRDLESPSNSAAAQAIIERSTLLWSRRPEHGAFQAVRLGTAIMTSRTRLELPPRGDIPVAHWQALLDFVNEYERAGPFPVSGHFGDSGSIGVAGEHEAAAEVACALIMQLAALHAPTHLSFAAFLSAESADDWQWLKWLPHLSSGSIPLPVWPIAHAEDDSAELVDALEALIRERQQAGNNLSRRRHLTPHARPDDEPWPFYTQAEAITPIVIVCVVADHCADIARLIWLGEQGESVGVHLLWVARSVGELPATCRTFVSVDAAGARAHYVVSARVHSLLSVERLTRAQAQDLARRLAAVSDASLRTHQETDLPAVTHLRDHLRLDITEGVEGVLHAWQRSDSLVQRWRSGAERSPTPLEAIIGQSAGGNFIIDLRSQGPHALVAGTTGAGKSEFLQSWIMSLASTVSPERLNFLLVDYKGGVAFAECNHLPHTVGLVTDLSPHLVRRALVSLRAELRHREELLAERDAKDLLSLEQQSNPDAPPVLVIVIDEFAALSREVPEFVEGVIDIAQRGRSLGLHLIMATQRPAGVITDNIRANTQLRVALRMADTSDSTDVIGAPDAAYFTEDTPGRGALALGPGRLQHFQTGYLGGSTGGALSSDPIEFRTLTASEGPAWLVPAEQKRPAEPSTKAAESDIEALLTAITGAAQRAQTRPPRRPWLDPLPSFIELSGTVSPHNQRHRLEASGDECVIGVQDRPAEQTQVNASIDFDAVGNVAIFGASGSGKTSALITIAASLSSMAGRRGVHLYAIDASNSALEVLGALPTVGTVARLRDLDHVGRVLRHLRDLVVARQSARATQTRARESRDSPAPHTPHTRDVSGMPHTPRTVLFIDGFSVLRQQTETIVGEATLLQMLTEIMESGRSVGVHVVITADRPSALPMHLASTVQLQFSLRLANANDYGFLGVPSDVLRDAPAGRALRIGDTDELQFAMAGKTAEHESVLAALHALADELRAAGVSKAPRVRTAPHSVHLTELPIETHGRITVGVHAESYEPVSAPTTGLVVISGPAGAGLSTAAHTYIHSLDRFARERRKSLRKVLLSSEQKHRTRRMHRSDHSLRNVNWDYFVNDDEEITQFATALCSAMGGRPRTPTAETVFASTVSPDERWRTLAQSIYDDSSYGAVVIDHPERLDNSATMTAIVDLARVARRAQVLVLFTIEEGNHSAAWELTETLRQAAWGLMLQPDESAPNPLFRTHIGRVNRSQFPPGRGFILEQGRITPVQIALATTRGDSFKYARETAPVTHEGMPA